jgi:HAMP domain-containing protein
MMKRLLAVLLSASVACAVLALIVLTREGDSTITLAELTGTTESRGNSGFTQSVAGGSPALAGLEIDAVFYGILGLCGTLLALRIVVSRVRNRRLEEPMRARRQLRQSNADSASPAAPRATRKVTRVLVPDDTEPEAQQRSNGIAGSTRRRDVLAYFIHGLTGKMIMTFSGIVAVFGLITVGLVYATLSSSLNSYVLQRVRVMALNVSDGAPGYIFKNNAVGLRELLRKHTNKSELAYILVENRAGEIFAHSFAALPEEISRSVPEADQRMDRQRTLRLGDAAVYEVSVPILEGRGGTVRVGIWREQVDREVNETITPLIRFLLFVAGAGILAAMFLAWRINRPILRLAAAAKAISSGDLDTPSPGIGDAGEFGELSRAVERMRSSVKAALIRLSR